MQRDALVSWFDDTLEAKGFPDYGPNSLQVEGAAEVHHLATATTASLAVITAAVEAGADMLAVHHGLFGATAQRLSSACSLHGCAA